MLLYLNSKRDALELYDGEPLTLLHSVSLSTIEFNVLRVLYKNIYKPCTRQELKQAGWPDRVVGPNSLNVCIMHLRKKLKLIITDSEIRVMPSHGYKLLIATSIHLANEDNPPAITLGANTKEQKKAEPNFRTSIRARTKRSRIQPGITNCGDSHRRLHWEDLILTACIWVYAFALYHSIYH